MPPCYHESLAVQEGHGLPGIVYGVTPYDFKNIIGKYQFCGVQNQLHLYPQKSNVEILYKNNKVITDSEFSFQFQLIDYGLLESITAEIMINEINVYNQQELGVGGSIFTVITFRIMVIKFSELLLFTHGGQKDAVYSGPIIHEHFRVKNFQISIVIPSFQCIIVIHPKSGFNEGEIKFFEITQPAVDKVKPEIDKEISASFPNTKCRHIHGIFCKIKVSQLYGMLKHKSIN